MLWRAFQPCGQAALLSTIPIRPVLVASAYLSPGVEFYGGIAWIDDSDPLNRQQHYVFPVAWGELPYGLEYNIGPGFGLTRGSDHVIVKFNLELERFAGMLFAPSSENGWFF